MNQLFNPFSEVRQFAMQHALLNQIVKPKTLLPEAGPPFAAEARQRAGIDRRPRKSSPGNTSSAHLRVPSRAPRSNLMALLCLPSRLQASASKIGARIAGYVTERSPDGMPAAMESA